MLRYKTLVCLAAVAGLSACASIHAPAPPPAGAGLHAVASEDGAGLRVAGVLRWSTVDVSEVEWQAGSQVDAEQRTQLCALLRSALQQTLQSDPARPGRTLSVRARIVELSEASPTINLASALLLFIPVDRGGASVQIDAFDQASGQRLASLSVAGAGKLGDFSAHFTRYGHAEEVLRRSATAFKDLLENQDESARTGS